MDKKLFSKNEQHFVGKNYMEWRHAVFIWRVYICFAGNQFLKFKN